MNKRILIYYLVVIFIAVCTFFISTRIQESNIPSLTGFDCVLKNACPDKWNDRSGKNISYQKFHFLLEQGHELNALLSYKFEDDQLVLSQKISNACNSFQVSYLISLEEDQFILLRADGTDEFNRYLQSIEHQSY